MKPVKVSLFSKMNALFAYSAWLYVLLAIPAAVNPAPIRSQILSDKPILGYRTTKTPHISLPDSVYNEITEKYNLLEKLNPTLFNTSILKQAETTRLFLEYLPRHLGSGVRGSVPLIDDPSKKITYTYFDRGSSELVVIGGGFANPREMLAPLLSIFVDYDVVIFDHVGHGLDHKPESWLGWFFKKTLEIDFTALKGGAQEENEVLTIVQHLKNKKHYKKLYGVGFCYSTGIFMKVAANNPGLFDKLILDGAWESGEMLMKRFAEKPELFFDPQRGSPSEQNMGFKKKNIYRLYMGVTALSIVQKHIRGTAVDLQPNGPALKKLGKVPVLLIHGINDLVISEKQFNQVWSNKEGEKTAILTDARHLQNHIKYKQLFSWCSNCFLDLGNAALEYSLTSPEALAQTYEELRQYKEHKQMTKHAVKRI